MADAGVMDGGRVEAPPAVTGLTVQMLNARRGALLDAAIETPQSGDASGGWGLRVRGHLLAAGGPAQAIEAVVPGTILTATTASLPTPDVAARHPGVPGADACGFTLLIDTLRLPLRCEVPLRAALPDGSRVKFAAMRGTRRRLQTTYVPRLQPLLVTSLGRMGTTLLMTMLAAHPGVVAYARPPYEARGGKYWLHLLKTLAAPADASKQLGAPMEFHLEPLAAGGNPFYSSEFTAWPEVERWSGAEYIADFAAFCQRSIDGWYLATARAQGQDLAPLAFFAEKHFPDDYPRLMRELYPESRELFLVRDFRDMVASMRAYNARKGYGDFGRERAASDEAWLADLQRGIEALRDARRERGSAASLVRYEALVREPEVALPPLLGALGLDASPPIVARMIAAAAPGAPELRGHGTTSSPDASIGRWRHDLPDELRSLMQQRFAGVLDEFGYARE
jgi:hypothetical protein